MKTWKIWFILTVILVALTASICVVAFMQYDNGDKNNSAKIQLVEENFKTENLLNDNFDSISIKIEL